MPASFISPSKPQEESSGADFVPENSLGRSYSLEDFHEYWQEALLAEKVLCNLPHQFSPQCKTLLGEGWVGM